MLTFNVCVSILARLPPHQSHTQTKWPFLSAPILRGPSAQGIALFHVEPAAAYILRSSSVASSICPGTGGILICVTLPVLKSAFDTVSIFICAHQPLPSPSAAKPYVFPMPSAFL